MTALRLVYALNGTPGLVAEHYDPLSDSTVRAWHRLDDAHPYSVACGRHGRVIGAQTHRAAVRMARWPQEWCERCRAASRSIA